VGQPLKVGVIGCGVISRIYLETMGRLEDLQVTAVADLARERAVAAAAAHPGVRVLDVDELIGDPDVDAIVNLTVPAAHFDLAARALEAGKHVYNEKPVTATIGDGASLMKLALSLGLRVGGAPDTVLGTGIQTARRVVDQGAIGQPIAANAFFGGPGHERWHHSPQYYFQLGGGPLMDMGPYYITALVHLLGPVWRVIGATSRSRSERVIAEGPDAGQRFPVEVDTHVAGVLEHTGGALSTLVMSFETWSSRCPRIEIHGIEGSLSVPDPNRFEGPVELFSPAQGEWAPVEVNAGYIGSARGYGVADMARAIAGDQPHRASGEMAYHVLEVMQRLIDSSADGRRLEIDSTLERPAPVPLGPLPVTG